MNLLKNLFHLWKDRKYVSFHKKLQHKIVYDSKRISTIGNFDLTSEQKREIDNYYKTNYGKTIDYICHRTYTAFSGHFDVEYIPETIYIPEIEHYMNMYSEYNNVLQDKNVTLHIAKSIGLEVPYTYFYSTKGLIVNDKFNIVSKADVSNFIRSKKCVFIKPTIDSGGGNGCMLIQIDNNIDVNSGKTIEAIIEDMGKNFAVQECVKCHDTLKAIYPKSVNTFRVLTYRWKDKIYIGSTILRIGIGGMLVDNASAGGIFIGINDNGELLPFAINKFGIRYYKHPDTNLVFDGYKIELYNKIHEAAIKIHSAIPQIGIANWDFTLNEEGNVVLIEANLDFGSPWLFQMTNGKSALGKHAKEILQWVNRIKHTTYEERINHSFGN